MGRRRSAINWSTGFAACGRSHDDLSMVKSHMVEIALPLNYPRMPPQCRMLTPIFHPNIAPHAICIGDHWSPGEPLWSIVARIGEMIAYQSYNTKSPLNGEAARWVNQHVDELPLDPVSMMPDDDGATAGAEAGFAGRRRSRRRDDRAAAADPGPAPCRAAADRPLAPVPPPVPAAAAPEAERRFACPQCGSIARWRPELAGKQLRCPRCKTVFRCPL